MSASRVRLAAILLLCTLLFGCRDKESTRIGGDDSDHLVTVFHRVSTYYTKTWVVVSSADGQQILAVRRITEAGRYDFGYSMPDRVTLTFISATDPPVGLAYGTFTSYLNVPRMVWNVDEDLVDTLGEAHLTIEYPGGDVDSVSFIWPDFYMRTTGNAMGPEVTHFANHVTALDDGRFSVLLLLDSQHGDSCGWLVSRAFNRNESNTYHVTIDYPLSQRVFTTSRPLDLFTLYARRGTTESSFKLGAVAASPAANSFALKVPNFPADAYFCTGRHSDMNSFFEFAQRADTLPLAVTIPEQTPYAVYDSSSGSYSSLSFDGPVDAATLLWQYPSWITDSTGTRAAPHYSWAVVASPQRAAVTRPVLPDSIFAELEIDPAIMYARGYTMEDYDPMQTFDDFIRMKYGSPRPREPRFTRSFSATTYIDER